MCIFHSIPVIFYCVYVIYLVQYFALSLVASHMTLPYWHVNKIFSGLF